MRRYRSLMFENRQAAGRALADELAGTVDPARCVLVAIPRGGVAVARPIADRLATPLTVAYARKLTSPLEPELAFGALDEDDQMITDPFIVQALGLRPDDIEKARVRVRAEIQRRMALYRVPPLGHYLPDRSVVLVDDGLATGLTMRAALAYARRHGARDVTVAVPCASAEAAERFRKEADRLVSLIVEEAFGAVGAYYGDFSPVTDDEVVRLLAGPLDRAPSGLRLSFVNRKGLRLAGELLLPAAHGPHPVVVFAHGAGSSKASPRNRAVARALTGAGIAACLFDFTGHGESQGTSEESTLAQQVDDFRAALALLDTLDDVAPRRVGIAGSSSGAAVALRVAAGNEHVGALVLRSANPEGAESAAREVTAPTLLVVGEEDAPIRAVNESLLEELGGPKRLEVVAGADHLFEDPEALVRATALTVAWFKEHLVRALRPAC